MTAKKESNTFEIFLNALVQDFGGLEIFDEENESRLNKAVKSLADSFSQEKRWMQIACMENIPQKLYSVIEFPQEAQQRMIDNCLKELSSLGLTSQVVEDVVAGFISVLKLKGSTKKEPEIKKVLGEAEIAGDTYKTCKIGNQIWMAENLRCSKLFGDEMGMAVPAYKHGRLYTHYGAQRFYDDGKWSLLKKDGWHLPTIEDWQKMVSYIEALGFDAGTSLKSKDDWGGDADSGLDLFGFAAHPIKYWDDNLPKKGKISHWQIKEEKAKTKTRNDYIELSTVSHYPCVQFWTNTNYVDNPYIDVPGADMAYVVTIDSSKNALDLDKGKISSWHDKYGFACIRFVKDSD